MSKFAGSRNTAVRSAALPCCFAVYAAGRPGNCVQPGRRDLASTFGALSISRGPDALQRRIDFVNSDSVLFVEENLDLHPLAGCDLVLACRMHVFRNRFQNALPLLHERTALVD